MKRFLGSRLIPAVITLVAIAAAVAIPLTLAKGPAPSTKEWYHHVSGIASTIPDNGDLNPYGTAVVKDSVGRLIEGDILVSNFNNRLNLAGKGTTIMEIAPDGTRMLFAQIEASDLEGDCSGEVGLTTTEQANWCSQGDRSQEACPGGVGLTTALVVLERGWVIVGSLPTTNGMPETARAGCLIVLNSDGMPVETFAGHSINGPWGMTALDQGDQATLFVANVLNGTVEARGKVMHTSTIIRIQLDVPEQGQGVPIRQSTTVIGSGFAAKTNAAALVIGPNGLGLSSDGTLFVADTLRNRIAAIPEALTRMTSASTGITVAVNGALNGPADLAVAPDGDIMIVNGNDGFMLEITPYGFLIGKKLVDKTKMPGASAGAGCLFGLAVRGSDGAYFTDDCASTLDLLH